MEWEFLFTKKINQISDSLHGSIHISELEKNIISTQVFNRLHHVLQNSTAYLTFPSNKTSRFAHSVGVMHLGGEMFKYAVTNGDDVAVKRMLEYIDGYLNDLERNDEFRNEIEYIFESMLQYRRKFEELKNQIFDDPFYKANTPFLIPENRIYSYIVAYQSLRAAALLHDLGHPPFSHITEDALNSIYASIQSKRDRNEDLNEREGEYYSIIGEYKVSGDKLHEKLSKHLVRHIFAVLSGNMDNQLKKLFCQHIKHTTLSILNDSSNEFTEIHRIVDGVIDCDRLDYVSRDPLASGFNDGSIEYERITKTMKLLPKEDNFKFCFSGRVMNTIEDFFNRRWRLYKHVILHHRVVKTDTLLFQVIRSLADEYLRETETNTDQEHNDFDFIIPRDISGLWKTVGKSFNLTQADYINHFIQWDDSWLLSCLRREYFKRKHQNRNDLLTIQLEELLSNKKHYFPLYKRYDGLLPLDISLIDQFDISCLTAFSNHPIISGPVQIILEYKFAYNKQIQQGLSWTSRISLHGLFIIAISELFDAWGKDNDFLNIFKASANEIRDRFEITDIIVKRNKLSTGLNDEPIIYDEDGINPIQASSRIELDLKSNKYVFPPYFIYIYAQRNLLPTDLHTIKEQLGRILANKLFQFFSEYREDESNV
ncbi:putative dGTPase [Chlamydia abortus]|nr:putative dGTPase [Chlamydia abortus]